MMTQELNGPRPSLLPLIFGALVLILTLTATSQAAPGEITGDNPTESVAPKSITPVVVVTGQISLSVDGCGSNDASAIIEVEKPAGATVRAAYMCAATIYWGPQLGDGAVMIDGVGFPWDAVTANSIFSWNHWADVTSLVSPKINAAPAGRVQFTITEVGTEQIDGEILAVIFDDPNQMSENTVALLFGAQNVNGDDFFITLDEPLDLSDPDLVLDMALGISYGYQSSLDFVQVSLIDVNGQRLTSSAGGQDDGQTLNGALITVGGLDDSNTNPDPYVSPAGVGFSIDDELYDLRPFVSDGDVLISVHTVNPSDDDNVLFASFSLSVAADVDTTVPPQFIPVGDVSCGDTLYAVPGNEITFSVRAEDNGTNGDNVNLSVTGLPPGAAMNPALPLLANPAISNFSWTPTPAQSGTWVVDFTAADVLDGQIDYCSYTIIVQDTSFGLAVIDPAVLFYKWAHTVNPIMGEIAFGEFSDRTIGEVDLSSLTVNGVLTPGAFAPVETYPGFTDSALVAELNLSAFILTYDPLDLWDTTLAPFTVEGLFTDGISFVANGIVPITSHTSGDLNRDNAVTVSDLTLFIGYLFRGSTQPIFVEAADVDHDGNVDVQDLTALIRIIFL